MTNMDDAAREREREKVFQQCERFLFAHGPQRPRAVLADLAAEAGPDEEPDRYGEGSLISDFERDVAGLLGKEAAVFPPSGTMAQQLALRILARRAGAALAGPTAFIAEARLWQRRHGGNLVQLYPFVLSARANLRRRLPKFGG